MLEVAARNWILDALPVYHETEHGGVANVIGVPDNAHPVG